MIAGKWKGRTLPKVPHNARPTLGRVRETFFAWLAPYIVDATVLDLFAGSGALGLEALSRGAKTAVFVDKDPQALSNIQTCLDKWGEKNGKVYQGSFPNHMPCFSYSKFDIICLDPPYHHDWVTQSMHWLIAHHLLSDHSCVICEWHTKEPGPVLPEDWYFFRKKKAGNVHYALVKHI